MRRVWIWQLTRHDLEAFTRWLADYQNERSGAPITYLTRSIILQRVSQIFTWAHKHDYTDRDYSVWVPGVEGKAPQRRLVRIEQLGDLMDAAGQLRKATRNQAILAVLIGTGMRLGECCQLDGTDVRFDARDGGQINIRRGKGGKPRVVLFDDTAGSYLSLHLAACDASDGPLFCGHHATRLGPRAIYGVVKKAAKIAGLADVIQGPHDLRRLFATTWNRGRKGLGYAKPLSLQLGHETAEMTLHYILQDVEDIREVFLSPFTVLAEYERAQANQINFDGRS